MSSEKGAGAGLRACSATDNLANSAYHDARMQGLCEEGAEEVARGDD